MQSDGGKGLVWWSRVVATRIVAAYFLVPDKKPSPSILCFIGLEGGRFLMHVGTRIFNVFSIVQERFLRSSV